MTGFLMAVLMLISRLVYGEGVPLELPPAPVRGPLLWIAIEDDEMWDCASSGAWFCVDATEGARNG